MNNSAAQHLTPCVLQDLFGQGWAFVQPEAGDSSLIERQLLKLASTLGTPQPTRGKTLVDRLMPQQKLQAHPKSLSALTGLDKQPWHIDLAHYQTPARYIIFSCESEGSNPVPTELVYWESMLDITNREAAYTEPFLVRNGSCSFYATILTQSQQFFRFDPGCMQPMTKGAKTLMTELCCKKIDSTLRINWKQGQAVIIDNWRMLHRRLSAHDAQDRVLLRISVTGENKT